MKTRNFDPATLLYEDEKGLSLESRHARTRYRQQGPDPVGNALYTGGSAKRRLRLERLAAGEAAEPGGSPPTEHVAACAAAMLAAGRSYYVPGADPDPWPHLKTFCAPGVSWPAQAAAPV